MSISTNKTSIKKRHSIKGINYLKKLAEKLKKIYFIRNKENLFPNEKIEQLKEILSVKENIEVRNNREYENQKYNYQFNIGKIEDNFKNTSNNDSENIKINNKNNPEFKLESLHTFNNFSITDKKNHLKFKKVIQINEIKDDRKNSNCNLIFLNTENDKMKTNKIFYSSEEKDDFVYENTKNNLNIFNTSLNNGYKNNKNLSNNLVNNKQKTFEKLNNSFHDSRKESNEFFIKLHNC